MEGCEFLTATAAADALAAGELTSEQLVEALLARIERLEPRLGAFVEVYGDESRAAARAADLARRAGNAASRFHGVPVALKDIIDIEGRVTTGGSKVWESRVSPVTATLARRLTDAGLIVIGKTRTVEFAMGSWGTNTHMGTPWNPWDLAVHRAPGGSSSGSGVSVAARLVPWAIGTDTGGSVRLPAAWNGLTGLKVTLGRVSCHGVLPLAHTLDTPGPMCRSVEDAVELYRLVQGHDPNDTLTWHVPERDPRPDLHRGVAGMRLARMPEHERDGVDRRRAVGLRTRRSPRSRTSARPSWTWSCPAGSCPWAISSERSSRRRAMCGSASMSTTTTFPWTTTSVPGFDPDAT